MRSHERNPEEFGYATKAEIREARKRIYANLRVLQSEVSRWKREGIAWRDILAYLNFDPETGEDFGYRGISDKYLLSDSEADSEMKLRNALKDRDALKTQTERMTQTIERMGKDISDADAEALAKKAKRRLGIKDGQASHY